MKKFLAATLFCAVSVCLSLGADAATTPTAREVAAALDRGDYAGAQQMMVEVVQAHPDSARAHYLYAEILDHNGQPVQALSELNLARKYDPTMHFTDPAHLAAIERRIRNDAARASGGTANNSNGSAGMNAATAATAMPAVQQAAHHGVPAFVWLIIVIALVVGILAWGVRRARRNDESRTQEDLRTQLKQATEVLNAVRALKLDIRLSTVPGHEEMAREAEQLEAQLLQTVEGLGNSLADGSGRFSDQRDRVISYARQYDSLKARAEGRPDPYPPQGADGYQFANEAERFHADRQPVQQTVIVQQPGGGMGMGGGLLTGVLLGEMMGGGRDRIIERDVIVDDRQQAGGFDGGIDMGQGSNDWDDGSGGIDMGGGGNDWSDN
jgi:uncharacterized membrane-anchored protein YhcB (DUF1043 family)